jgi:predicted porin
MKKTSLAVAAAVLSLGAGAAELQAGKDTKFEVNVDVGVYHLSKKNTGVSEKEFKGAGLNQIEIKAAHKLPNGVTLLGEIEVDYDPIVDNNPVITDDMRIGFSSPSFGRLTFGQFDSFLEDNVMEVLGIGHGDTAGFMTEPASANRGRQIQYQHKIGDLSFAVDFSFSNNATKNDEKIGTAIGLSYKLGDLTLAAGTSDRAKYSNTNNANTVNTHKSSNGIALTYKLGNAKLMGLLASQKSTAGVKTDYTGAAVSYAMGAFDVGLSMQQRKAGNTKFNEMAMGVGYTVFKGMQVYLDMNRLDKPNKQDDSVEMGIKYSF